MTYERGVTSGWSVWPNPTTGAWHWSAYSARGSRTGCSPTEDEAKTVARTTELELAHEA